MALEIDIKDKKILYYIDLDSRQPLGALAKKVRLPKTVVAYRLRRLEKEGIIKNYYTLIDASKLGFSSIRFYIKFAHVTPEKEKEIMDYFVNNEYTYWVGPKRGVNLDAVVIMWSKSQEEMYNFLMGTMKKYAAYIDSYQSSHYIRLNHFHYPFLLGNERISDAKYEYTGGSRLAEFDKKDVAILNILSSDARASYLEIALKTKMTAPTVRQRIKRLVKEGIIKAFRANIVFSKLGYLNYKLDLYLTDYSKHAQILDFLKSHPNLIYLDETIGCAGVEAEFYFKDFAGVNETIGELKRRFAVSIETIDTSITPEFYKIEYMPKVMLK